MLSVFCYGGHAELNCSSVICRGKLILIQCTIQADNRQYLNVLLCSLQAVDMTDMPVSRGAIGRIPSIVITSEFSSLLPSVRPSYRSSRSSITSAGANLPRRDSRGGVQQGAVLLSTAAETPEAAHLDNPRPKHPQCLYHSPSQSYLLALCQGSVFLFL